MVKAPKTAVAVICIVILATLARGLLGISMLAGILISLIAGIWWASAITGSVRRMRVFAIALMVYGGAFIGQAVLLPRYVGSRELDAAWGAVLLVAGIYFLLSRSLKTYYAERVVIASAPSGESA
jgi:hypothetical protein